MKPKKLFQQWHRRRQRLLSSVESLLSECRAGGDVERVHELRVTLRRLRLYVRVGRPVLDQPSVTAFRTWARAISKLTSPVRDLDVAIEWLQGQTGAEAAIAQCQQQRDRLWASACPSLPTPPPSVLRALGRTAEGTPKPMRLAKRLRKLESRYETAAREGLPRFFKMTEAGRHQFRRTLRWWRYLRELDLPRRDLGRDTLLKHLLAAQESTGNRQNLALAGAALRRLGRTAHSPELRRSLREAQARQARLIREALVALARLKGWER